MSEGDVVVVLGLAREDQLEVHFILEDLAEYGQEIIYLSRQFGDGQPKFQNLRRYDGQGNITIWTNSEAAASVVERWIWTDSKYRAPRCLADVQDESFARSLRQIINQSALDFEVKTAFPAEFHEEEQAEQVPIDVPETEDHATSSRATPSRTPMDAQDALEREADMLEQIPMPGVPKDEYERRRKWLTLPRKARVAIRKMHNELGHVSISVLLNILRASRADKDMIDAAKLFKCIHCENNKPAPQTSKVALPKPYVFNFYIGVDVFELHDAAGDSHSFFNIVCLGTRFQVVGYLGMLRGPPKSSACLDILVGQNSLLPTVVCITAET